MSRSKSSARWLRRRKHDVYYRWSHERGLRSRAVFKLKEIDDKYSLLHPGMMVLDLGAAPGGWSQYAAQRVAPTGMVVAVDLLPMQALPMVKIVCGDVHDDRLIQSVLAFFHEHRPDIVLSDMAPQWSGNSSLDLPRALDLLQRVFVIALRSLPANHYCLLKTFQGGGLDDSLKNAKQRFASIKMIKPAASSSSSPEVYVLARTKAGT